MKTGYALALFILIIAVAFAGYMAGRIENTGPNPLQIKVDELQKIDQTKEARYNKIIDSVNSEYKAIKKADELIDKAIKKILKSNEDNKKRVFNGSDSLKLFVSDSLLRANGFK